MNFRIFFFQGDDGGEFIQVGLGKLVPTMNLLASSKKTEKCNKPCHKTQMKILTLFYPWIIALRVIIYNQNYLMQPKAFSQSVTHLILHKQKGLLIHPHSPPPLQSFQFR